MSPSLKPKWDSTEEAVDAIDGALAVSKSKNETALILETGFEHGVLSAYENITLQVRPIEYSNTLIYADIISIRSGIIIWRGKSVTDAIKQGLDEFLTRAFHDDIVGSNAFVTALVCKTDLYVQLGTAVTEEVTSIPDEECYYSIVDSLTGGYLTDTEIKALKDLYYVGEEEPKLEEPRTETKPKINQCFQ